MIENMGLVGRQWHSTLYFSAIVSLFLTASSASPLRLMQAQHARALLSDEDASRTCYGPGAVILFAVMSAGVVMGMAFMALSHRRSSGGSRSLWTESLQPVHNLPAYILKGAVGFSALLGALLIFSAIANSSNSAKNQPLNPNQLVRNLATRVTNANAPLPSDSLLAARAWLADAHPSAGAVSSISDVVNRADAAHLSPEGILHLSALEQELFCAHMHPLTIPGSIKFSGHKYPGLEPGILTHHVYASGDIVSEGLRTHGVWELGDVQELDWALTTPLPPDAAPTSTTTPGLFVDVGANIGTFFLFAAARGFESVGFEAMKSNQLMVRSSLCDSPSNVSRHATLVPFALGEEKSKCKLYSHPTNAGDGIMNCGKGDLPDVTSNGYVSRGVMSIVRLDDVIQRDVRALKMDVEGYEPKVFAGAQKLLKEHTVWFMMFENNAALLHSNIKGGDNPAAYAKHILDLAELGYSCSSSGFLGPYLDHAAILAIGADKTKNRNIFCVHRRYTEWEGRQRKP